MVGLLGADVESNFLEGGEMKIEKTGEYLARSGLKVVVTSLSGHCEQNVIGYIILDNKRHLPAQWFENGIFFETGDTCSSDIVAEWTEPKPPQYVPYTWADREELRGRWYRRKSEKSEEMITNLDFVSRYEQCVFEIDSYTAAEFLENCEWLDGTPCGKKVE